MQTWSRALLACKSTTWSQATKVRWGWHCEGYYELNIFCTISDEDFRCCWWQLLRDGNTHGSGMSHAMTASPKSSFRAPFRWAMLWLAEEILSGQHQRVDISACRKDWKRITVELSIMSLLTNRSVTGLNWTELKGMLHYWCALQHSFVRPLLLLCSASAMY